MISERSRLLILLVLVSVVATAGWSTALAREKTAALVGGPSWTSVSRPLAAPTSGEPDVGQTPHPAPTKNGSALDPGTGGQAGPWGTGSEPWFRWILRMWTMRYLGAR